MRQPPMVIANPPVFSDSVGFAIRCSHLNIIRPYKTSSCRIVKEWIRQPDGNERTATSLYDQGAFKVNWLVFADVFDATAHILVKRINSETVFVGIDDLEETTFEQ